MSSFSVLWNNWTWLATEGETEDEDFRFFGYVIGHEEEWGYFVLSEMEEACGPGGLTIERDIYFKPGHSAKFSSSSAASAAGSKGREALPAFFHVHKKTCRLS